MLGSQKIVAFVATARPEEARRFYEETLGLRLVADEPFALVFDAGGTTLRVQKVEAVSPAPRTVLGWRVPDVVAAVQALEERGVSFARYESMDQDELGIWHVPGGGMVAWFKDPDGNTLSLSAHEAPAD